MYLFITYTEHLSYKATSSSELAPEGTIDHRDAVEPQGKWSIKCSIILETATASQDLYYGDACFTFFLFLAWLL